MATFPRALFVAPTTSLAEAIGEYFSCYELLRIVGFTPDELFLSLIPLDDGSTGIRATIRRGAALLSPGDREFNADLAATPAAPEECADAYRAEALRHRSFTAAESEAWVENVRERSRIRGRVVELIAALTVRGFDLSSSTAGRWSSRSALAAPRTGANR